jgi:8-oxo-dGTP pyrophosphatase MutT (NUDIX family)
MSISPKEFFVDLMDFFSILLPGALLAYLLKDDVGPRLFGNRYYHLQSTEGWIVFVFSCYLLGHIIFLLGACLLDDHVYDPMRKGTFAEQVKNLADGKGRLSRKWARRLAKLLIKPDTDKTLREVLKIKKRCEASGGSGINAFQWSKARLVLEHPEAIAAVQRFEADSKFFRSFVMVLCFVIPWGLLVGRWQVAVGAAFCLILAFWRYVDQRVKSINQAHYYIITLEGERKTEMPAQTTSAEAAALTHAGGVVFKRDGHQVKWLIVQAKRNPQEWVLPKGHIEAGEHCKETAVREVREETGVWARVVSGLNDLSYESGEQTVNARFFLMECVQEEKPLETQRKHKWLAFNEAKEQLSYKEGTDLLAVAQGKKEVSNSG